MKVYIAEKPELARAIADAISDKQEKKQGYIIVEKNIVTWCFGHLLTLKDPHEYNNEYKKWTLETLPLQIENYELKPIAGKEKQISTIKSLIKNATEIVHAGDPDEEGQLLVDELIKYLNFRGKVSRVLINDNTKDAVRKALNNLQGNDNFKNLSDSAYYRSISDYEYGMNLTRAYTIINNRKNPVKKGKTSPVLSVGRVQTPVLNLIFNREQEVKQHIKQQYYHLSADKVFKYDIPKENLENNMCIDKEYLETIKKQCETTNDFKIVTIEKKKQIQYSPLVYNLLELQADAYKKYKYPPDKTKDITQKLRETYKAITYNRSDCQYLSSEHFEQRKELINSILKNLELLPKYKNSKNILNLEQKHKAFNDKNITAHHGIIPTINDINISDFNEDEKKVYLMIVDRYLMLFLPPKITLKTKYVVENSINISYFATKSVIDNMGYELFLSQGNVDPQTEQNQNTELNYKEGELLKFQNFIITEHETQPKQLYTFATLLKDLTAVAKYVKDTKLRAILIEKDKEKKGEKGGIGTPATRDVIIKLLLTRNFIEVKKDKLVTTSLGKQFLSTLSENAKTPELTAIWNYKQKDIREGKLSSQDAIKQVKEFIKDEIKYLKQQL